MRGLVLIFHLLFFGCSPGGVAVDHSSPMWLRLAAVDLETSRVPEKAMARYRIAFRALTERCMESDERLGEELLASQRELAQRGVLLSVHDVMAELETMLTSLEVRAKCSEATALYVRRRTETRTE